MELTAPHKPPVICLYADRSKATDIVSLKGYVRRQGDRKRKHFTTPIIAHREELSKFDRYGYLNKGNRKPPHPRLQRNIQRLIACYWFVAWQAEEEGALMDMPSRVLSNRAMDLYELMLCWDIEQEHRHNNAPRICLTV